ncbi:hypothetical protein PoB_003304400 [Plakobranchus ocellatus]|uniref:Uncharacterized protein n=1 Tax=Plakobranchus ocellatus TaxID=259542 RepID=A0AAV4AJY1_9GAST|nr:hypothetical protein PoB_003304400 [Plakobranchus ocellatus]
MAVRISTVASPACFRSSSEMLLIATDFPHSNANLRFADDIDGLSEEEAEQERWVKRLDTASTKPGREISDKKPKS